MRSLNYARVLTGLAVLSSGAAATEVVVSNENQFDYHVLYISLNKETGVTSVDMMSANPTFHENYPVGSTIYCTGLGSLPLTVDREAGVKDRHGTVTRRRVWLHHDGEIQAVKEAEHREEDLVIKSNARDGTCSTPPPQENIEL